MTHSEWWTPLKRTEVKVLGPDQAEPALLSIRFKLAPDPKSNQWIEYFLHPQLDPWQAFRRPSKESSGMGGIGFIGAVEDDRLEEYVATIDSCVAQANARFESEDIPTIDAEQLRTSEAAEAARSRIERAQERLNKL